LRNIRHRSPDLPAIARASTGTLKCRLSSGVQLKAARETRWRVAFGNRPRPRPSFSSSKNERIEDEDDTEKALVLRRVQSPDLHS
jgi:hypothetical protein